MKNPMWKIDSNFNQIIDIAYSFQKSKVFFTAIELDVFSIIADGSMSAVDIAERIGCKPNYTERLLNALCSMGLLKKEERLFSNSDAAKKHLVEGSSEYIGSLMHINNLWDAWTDLSYCLKHGAPKSFRTIDEKDDKWVQDYLISLKWKAYHEAPDVVSMMSLRGAKNIIDLGAGSCSYLVEILKQYPTIQAYAFDFPKVIANMQNCEQNAAYFKQITMLSGDLMKDDFGSGYDAVLMSYLLNEYSIWDNIALMQKVYDSLNKGGTVYIHQQIISDDKTYPLNATMESINMLVNTPNGDAMTETDLWIILKESNFQEIKFRQTEFGTCVVTAKKLSSF